MHQAFRPRVSSRIRYVLIAVLAFLIGNASFAAAGPVVSGFVGLIDGTNTAAINASGELSVSDTDARSHLASVDRSTSQLSFDAAGNLRTMGRTAQVLSDYQTPLTQGTVLVRTFDVSGYDRIRVTLRNIGANSSTLCGGQPNLLLNIAHYVNGNRTTFIQLFDTGTAVCDQFDKIYDVPGGVLYLQVIIDPAAPAGSSTRFDLDIYGR